MLSLGLQAIPGSMIKFNRRKKNKVFREVAEKVAINANYKCQYCSVDCQSWFEVVNIDGNYMNNVHSNFALACKVCANCLLMDQYDIDYKGEECLIYLPEIKQADLNIMSIAMAKMSLDDKNKENMMSAKTLYSSLKDRAELLKELCQSDLSHPGVFLFVNASRNKSYELVSGMRLLQPLSTVSEYL